MTIYRNGLPEANPEQEIIEILRDHAWQPGTWRHNGTCKCGWAQGSTGEFNHPVHVAQKLAAEGVTRIPQASDEENRLVTEIHRLNKVIIGTRDSLTMQLRC